jgi:hypothetical protein
MLQVIRDAGFTPVPEEVRLVVTGVLSKNGDRFVLALDAMTRPLALDCEAAREQGGSGAPALSEFLGRHVEVQARWLAVEGGRLEVAAVRPAGP